jgi:hypothetical protein
MPLSILTISCILCSTLVLSSCQKEQARQIKELLNPDKPNTYKGPELRVGAGHARTFATIGDGGVPKEVGVVLTKEALSGLPTTNTTYQLEFHSQAREATLFEHVALGLSATGHGLPPSGEIGAHFDYRFFMTSAAERLAIPAPATSGFPAGGGFDVAPPPGYLPANFAMNAAVAQIGRHWGENIFHPGHHVDHTMILGTWNGKLTFINPIVTLPTLASGQHHSVAFPQPQRFAEPGYYPTRYNIYKDDKGSHYVSLSHFVKR